MKTSIKISTIIMLIIALFSCNVTINTDDFDENRMIWDISPTSINISIVDKYNACLLDSISTDSPTYKSTFVMYKGKRYDIIEEDFRNTRAIAPRPLALRRYYNTVNKHYELSFGEFNSEGNFKKEKFTLHYNNSIEQDIFFDAYTTWSYDINEQYDRPTIHNTIYMNGREYKNSFLTIVVQ